jgi:PAS domain-containing protein
MDAVNRAAVFKFISKPWIDSELLLAVEAAVQHALRKKTNAKLIHEIGEQNQKLEVLSQNLESEVVSRTQSIEDSRSQAEIKERSVKELVAFVKNLSQVSTAAELYETINQEIWRYHGVLTLYFLFLHGAEKGKIYWTQSRTLHEKTVSPRASHFKDLNIRFNHQDDRQWWVESLKKEPIQLAAIPVRGRESNQNGPLALIFLDHNLKPEMLNQLMDRMTERLQVMTIVLDKILLAEQLIMATEQWQATFSAFSDPIAVVDNQENVIRANRTFYKDKKRQCYEMFDDREEICGG